MKKISILPFFVLIILLSDSAFAQNTLNGLQQFLSTDFMSKFNEARRKSEESVQNFKQIQQDYSEEDIQRVMDAYNASADKYNNILIKIKEDLLNKQTRKFLIASPDTYASSIESELNEAKDFYANNYVKVVTKVTEGRITGTPFLVLLPEIIKYGKLAWELFKGFKAELRLYNDSILEQKLVRPNSFSSWNGITAN